MSPIALAGAPAAAPAPPGAVMDAKDRRDLTDAQMRAAPGLLQAGRSEPAVLPLRRHRAMVARYRREAQPLKPVAIRKVSALSWRLAGGL